MLNLKGRLSTASTRRILLRSIAEVDGRVVSRHLILAVALIPLCLGFAAVSAGAQETTPAGIQDPVPEAAQEAAPDASSEETPAGERMPKRFQIDLTAALTQARAALRDGRFEEAVKLYQLILHFVPDSRVVRIELSFALAGLGDRQRAVRLLRDINREGLPPEVITTIDRILGPDRLTFFLIPEIIYDNNINGQTKKNIIFIGGVPFRLSEDAKGREAYGYGLTFGAAYRLLDEAPRTTLTLGTRVQDLNARQDDTIDLFSSMSFAFRAGQRGLVTPSFSGAYRTKADERYEWEQAGGMSFRFPVGPVDTTLSGRHRMIEGLGDFKDVRDRRRSEVNASIGYGFPGLGIRADGGVFREDWGQVETQDNDGFTTGLDFTLTKIPMVTPTIGGSFTRIDFENEAAFFNVKRRDLDYEGHIDLLLSDLNLFGNGGIVVGYRYRHETSNIPIFEYDKHEVSLGFKAITF